eukprot:scaffold474446_cov30-Prasinocladus_malaysianus.AAC.1
MRQRVKSTVGAALVAAALSCIGSQLAISADSYGLRREIDRAGASRRFLNIDDIVESFCEENCTEWCATLVAGACTQSPDQSCGSSNSTCCKPTVLIADTDICMIPNRQGVRILHCAEQPDVHKKFCCCGYLDQAASLRPTLGLDLTRSFGAWSG